MENKNSARYSRQRECILCALESTKLHPTANWIYDEVRKEISNISLGTVYRNLARLCAEGTILKIDVGDGTERYDFCNMPHYHLHCKSCGKVVDVEIPYVDGIDCRASEENGMEIDYHSLIFYGKCSSCNKKIN